MFLNGNLHADCLAQSSSLNFPLGFLNPPWAGQLEAEQEGILGDQWQEMGDPEHLQCKRCCFRQSGARVFEMVHYFCDYVGNASIARMQWLRPLLMKFQGISCHRNKTQKSGRQTVASPC